MGGAAGASGGAQEVGVASAMAATGGEGGGGAAGKGGSPSHFVLSGQKMQLLERMKKVRMLSFIVGGTLD